MRVAGAGVRRRTAGGRPVKVTDRKVERVAEAVESLQECVDYREEVDPKVRRAVERAAKVVREHLGEERGG